MQAIPKPSISRLCKIYNLLEEMELEDIKTISSKEIGDILGVGSHNIRKDISYLGETGTTGSGYEIEKLKELIEVSFGFNQKRFACIIGLNSLGTAMLHQKKLFNERFKIIAGFDTNINKVETLKSDVPLYPTYEIIDIVKNYNIEFAIIADPGNDAQKITDRLIEGGVKGIVNLSSSIISTDNKDVVINNIDIIGEFRYLIAILNLKKKRAESKTAQFEK